MIYSQRGERKLRQGDDKLQSEESSRGENIYGVEFNLNNWEKKKEQDLVRSAFVMYILLEMKCAGGHRAEGEGGGGPGGPGGPGGILKKLRRR